MKLSTIILAPLFAASYVSAHGVEAKLLVNNKEYLGNRANGRNPSVIRAVSSEFPVKGANNPDLTCGSKSGPAALVADAMPGDSISFDWKSGGTQKWPHNTGPMETYLASCAPVTCDKFNQDDARWFKIHEAGRKSDGTWFQSDLYNGKMVSVKLPNNIAPGDYLIRHEILGLHMADKLGGAEFYPNCAQLRIGGNGNGVPTANELVRFPGAYKDDDPGILAPGVFNPTSSYKHPGPTIAKFVEDSGPTPSLPGTPPEPSTSTGPTPKPSTSTVPTPKPSSLVFSTPTPATSTPTPTRSSSSSTLSGSKPSSSPRTCRRNVTLVAAGEPTPTSTPEPSTTEYRPRHLGHIMRRVESH